MANIELTEDMLRRIANSIGDLRLKIALVRELLTQMGANPEELDRVANQTLQMPEFQHLCNQIFAHLKGGH